jgi:hypothetical protein
MADVFQKAVVSIPLPVFLKTGGLGPIHLLISDEAVLANLGQPEDTARFKIEKGRFGHIWKYGDLEITIINHAVTTLHLETRSFDAAPLKLPARLKIEGPQLSIKMTLEASMDYLNAQSIAFTRDPALTFDTQTCLRIGNSVRVIFDEDEQLAVINCT